MKTILVTGVLGFIFSNFIEWALENYPQYKFVGIDKAVKSYNLCSLRKHDNYTFYLGDVADQHFVNNVFAIERPNIVIHGAAESFVDDSIRDITPFLHSNVLGTSCLVNVSLSKSVEKFIYISTDEVYGQLKIGDESWTEKSFTNPRNPYSASKMSGELIVRAAHETHGLVYNITRSSNNFGPVQPHRNLVPKIISSTLTGVPIPIHGSGNNYREWLYVLDHCSAVMAILENGVANQTYNVGSGVELTNLEMVEKLCRAMGKKPNFEFVKDRPGHDFRYSVDCTKLKELGWAPKFDFDEGMAESLKWYKQNQWYFDK